MLQYHTIVGFLDVPENQKEHANVDIPWKSGCHLNFPRPSESVTVDGEVKMPPDTQGSAVSVEDMLISFEHSMAVLAP